MSKNGKLTGCIMLFAAAMIWGSGFATAIMSMDHIGPFTFICLRNFVGAAVLIPVAIIINRKTDKAVLRASRRKLPVAGLVCGLCLFVASNLQQYAMSLGTSSGKAGFITAFYVVLVPVSALVFLKKKTSPALWLAVALAITGLYLLCGDMSKFCIGDLYAVGCAFAFTAHVLVIEHYSKEVNSVELSMFQFFVTGVLSIFLMFFFEEPEIGAILDAKWTILYTGAFSSGVAYTLQIAGQKRTPPTVASIIMSLESVFSVVFGVLILSERLSLREGFGCMVMFAAIILALVPAEKWRAVFNKKAAK